MNFFEEIVEKLNNPVIAWKVVSNYFIGYLLNYGPKYQEYLRTPESRDMDNNFFGDDNDSINHIMGFKRTITPKQRFEKLIECYSYCFEKNRQGLALMPAKERQFVAAMTPVEAAGFRQNRDVREPNMGDIDAKVVEGKFRASYADKIKANRRRQAQQFHTSVENAAEFVVSEVSGSIAFATDQCGAMITDGDYGLDNHIDEDEMAAFISDDAKQKIFNKMYHLYESKAAYLFDAKERQPELLADHMFAEDDMLLLSEYVILPKENLYG